MRFNRFDAGSLIGGAALLAGGLMFSAAFDANPAMAYYDSSGSSSR